MKVLFRPTPYVYALSLFLCICTLACQSPQVNQIVYDEIPDTGNLHFAPTMQEVLPEDKNSVYAVSFPLAWQIVRQQLGIMGAVNTESDDLSRLDGSKTVDKALDDDDYEREIEWDDRLLRVKTKQEVNLTFAPSFEDLPHGLTFDSIRVDAFGTSGFQNMEYTNRLDIAAYRDDDRFALRLRTMEPDHEIYLFKADSVYGTFQQMYTDLREACRHRGESWRHQLTDMDAVVIPKINFDQFHRFNQFIKTHFSVMLKKYVIVDASQQVSFSLNQHGVSMKSEAEIIVNDGAYPPDETPAPKHLIFDKPFYILMKKTDMENPYFVLYVADAALMESQNTKGEMTP